MKNVNSYLLSKSLPCRCDCGSRFVQSEGNFLCRGAAVVATNDRRPKVDPNKRKA